MARLPAVAAGNLAYDPLVGINVLFAALKLT